MCCFKKTKITCRGFSPRRQRLKLFLVTDICEDARIIDATVNEGRDQDCGRDQKVMPGKVPNPTFIYRITHYKNLGFILQNGLCCPNHALKDPSFVNIGHKKLIDDRGKRNVPVQPRGTLNDYIAFYFTRKSPMLYLIAKHNVPDFAGDQSEIVYLVSRAQEIEGAKIPFVFTDRHAKLDFAQFGNSLSELTIVDWDVIASDIWSNTLALYDRKEKKQAEFLVYQQLPIGLVRGIVCQNKTILRIIEQTIQQSGVSLAAKCIPDWYY